MHRAWVTSNLVGGLGNQLFLVANLLATARRHTIPAFLQREPWSSSCEAPRPTYWSSIFKDIDAFGVHASPPMVVEMQQVDVPETRPLQPVALPPASASGATIYRLIGFFQSEAVFADFPVIRDVIPVGLHELAASLLRQAYLNRCEAGAAHVIGMHLRRGDYVRMRDVFAFLQIEGYYDHALRRLLGNLLLGEMSRSPTRLPRVQLLIFCEEEGEGQLAVGYFRSKYPGLAVTHVHPRHETATPRLRELGLESCPREVLELLMLAHCHDVVMANSSFSWWAAYLGEEPLQRPFSDYAHLYRDSWLIL
eukprot:gene10767-7495_t